MPYFPRMHQDGIQRSLGYLFDPDEPASRVEQDNLKVLHFIHPVFFPEQAGDPLGSIEDGQLSLQLPGHANGQREGAFERDGFVATNPFGLAEVVEGGARKVVEGLEFFQQMLGNLDGRGSLEARAQENGDQLGIFQRVGPMFRQPFARTLAQRQIFDAEAGVHATCTMALITPVSGLSQCGKCSIIASKLEWWVIQGAVLI